MVVALNTATHLHMHAHVVNLQQNAVRWTQGDNLWAIVDAESLVAECHALLLGVEVPVVEHCDVELQIPASDVEVSKRELSAVG